LSDLSRYPDWLEIVSRAVPVDEAVPLWQVDLRGQIGPLRRTKRLHMARVECSEQRIRFERREADGRQHSAWTLDFELAVPGPGEVEVDMAMQYDGRLWIPVLDRLLADEIQRSKARLAQMVAG
jgi:hypothetical protein